MKLKSLLFFLTVNLLPILATAKDSAIKKEVQERWQECKALEKNPSSKESWVAPDDDVKEWTLLDKDQKDLHGDYTLVFDQKEQLRWIRERIEFPSGDHSVDREYCFRSNGTLAFVLNSFVTYQVMDADAESKPVKEVRRFWVAEGTGKTEESTEVRSAQTDKLLSDRDVNYAKGMALTELPKNLSQFTTKKFLARLPKRPAEIFAEIKDKLQAILECDPKQYPRSEKELKKYKTFRELLLKSGVKMKTTRIDSIERTALVLPSPVKVFGIDTKNVDAFHDYKLIAINFPLKPSELVEKIKQSKGDALKKTADDEYSLNTSKSFTVPWEEESVSRGIFVRSVKSTTTYECIYEDDGLRAAKSK